MSQILTVIMDVDNDGRMAVNWFESDGLTDAHALAAVQAVERALQKRIAKAEAMAELEAKAREGPNGVSEPPILDG